MKHLGLPDYAVLLAYFAVVIFVGIWFGRRSKTSRKFFLAGGSVPSWIVAFSLMGSMISSGSVVGTPGTVYEKGLILLPGHLSLLLVLVFVATFIVPFYRNVVGLTAYEYINKRFGVGSRIYASLGFLVDRIFDLGITLVTAAIAVYVMTGWPVPWVIVGVGFFITAYTVFGGMEAVACASVLQGVVMVVGMLITVATLLFTPQAGPPGSVVAAAWESGRFSLGNFELSVNMLFDTQHTSGWLFLLAFLVSWSRRYICDQHMVQRYLMAKSTQEARKGAAIGAASCIPIWLTFMFIGLCLYGYYSVTNQVPAGKPDEIVPHYLVTALPAGLVGLILSTILAASINSVSGDLAAVATVLTNDYVSALFPVKSDRTHLLIGRIMVFAGGALSTWVAWLLIPKEGMAPLMERCAVIAVIISSGSLGLFMLGFLTRRATRAGCYVGIAACLIFTAWGLLTTGGDKQLVNLPLNFTMNPILIGVFGHFVLFGAGYVSSLLLPGRPPVEIDHLTIWSSASKKVAGDLALELEGE